MEPRNWLWPWSSKILHGATFALTKAAFFPATKSAWDLSFPLDALGEANWMKKKPAILGRVTIKSQDQALNFGGFHGYLSILSMIFPSYSHHIPIIFPSYSYHIPIIFLSYSHYLPTIFPSKNPMISPGYHSQESNIFYEMWFLPDLNEMAVLQALPADVPLPKALR